MLRLREGSEVRFVASGRPIRQGLEGFWFSSISSGGLKCVLLRSSISDFSLEFEHYYQGFHFTYRSSLTFLLHYLSRFAFFYKMYEHLAQRRFNRTKLVRRDRMRVLQYIQEQTLADRAFQVSTTSLMTDLFSRRWVSHPKQAHEGTYYEFVLRSLADEGNLVKASHSYSLAPKALQTLSEYEEDNRRHRTTLRVQIILAALTSALIVIGIPQAVAAAIQAYQFFVGS